MKKFFLDIKAWMYILFHCKIKVEEAGLSFKYNGYKIYWVAPNGLKYRTKFCCADMGLQFDHLYSMLKRIDDICIYFKK